MNLNSGTERSHFWRAWKTARESLRPFRENREKLIRASAGTEYGDRSDDHRRPTLLNLLNMTANVHTFMLSANRPRVLVSTDNPSLRPFAERFQVATNNLIKEIKLEKTLRRAITDAFYSIGIVKVSFAPTGRMVPVENPDALPEPGIEAPPQEWEAYRKSQSIYVDPGKPFAEAVSLDDFVFDIQSKCWDRCRFMGHRYRVPYSVALEDTRFNQEVLKAAGPSSKWGSGANDGEDEASGLSRDPDHDELESMITLVDLYFPRTNTWAIVVDGREDLPPLMVTDWDGPETGPFRILCFGDIPDNIMPASPGQHLYHLHELSNRLLRKAANQAKNQKTVLAYTGDGKDAKQVKAAQDMEMRRVNNIDAIRELNFNGVDQLTLMMHQVVDGLFSRGAGNLDAMAGLGPQSGTASQDQLIHDSVSRREAELQYLVVEFAAGIASDLGWMLWVDEVKELRGARSIPGVNQKLDASWTPGQREGDFLQYNFEVEPYSMAYRSPSQRVQSLMQVITQVYGPLAPFLQQAGGTIDMEALNRILADLMSLPRLEEIITFPGAPQALGGMPGMQGGMPGQTSREYIRRNVSTAGSPGSQRTMIAQALAGGGGQSSGAVAG